MVLRMGLKDGRFVWNIFSTGLCLHEFTPPTVMADTFKVGRPI
jgi:hypothetical protein